MRTWLNHGAVCLTLLLAACQDGAAPDPTQPVAPISRDQAWRICQDPSRGLVAANACTQLIQSGQENNRTLAYAHYNRGMAIGRRGRTQAAIADYDAALQLDPLFGLAFYQRGLLFQEMGQQIRADQDLTRARQLDPRLR